MAIYIIQSKKTGGILWAGSDRPKYTVLGTPNRDWAKTFWVIEIPTEGEHIYHNADQYLEVHGG